jgi:hypothetical protein
MGREIIG